MNLDRKVHINNNIDSKSFNGERVMMNLEKGKYFAFNGIGSKILDIIESEGEIELYVIVDKLLELYDVTNEICEKTVINFIGKLMAQDIVVIS